MDKKTRYTYAGRITEIAHEMAIAGVYRMTGVDDGQLTDLFLTGGDEMDCSPKYLQARSEKPSVDCSSLFLYHCALGPVMYQSRKAVTSAS